MGPHWLIISLISFLLSAFISPLKQGTPQDTARTFYHYLFGTLPVYSRPFRVLLPSVREELSTSLPGFRKDWKQLAKTLAPSERAARTDISVHGIYVVMKSERVASISCDISIKNLPIRALHHNIAVQIGDKWYLLSGKPGTLVEREDPCHEEQVGGITTSDIEYRAVEPRTYFQRRIVDYQKFEEIFPGAALQLERALEVTKELRDICHLCNENPGDAKYRTAYQLYAPHIRYGYSHLHPHIKFYQACCPECDKLSNEINNIKTGSPSQRRIFPEERRGLIQEAGFDPETWGSSLSALAQVLQDNGWQPLRTDRWQRPGPDWS